MVLRHFEKVFLLRFNTAFRRKLKMLNPFPPFPFFRSSSLFLAFHIIKLSPLLQVKSPSYHLFLLDLSNLMSVFLQLEMSFYSPSVWQFCTVYRILFFVTPLILNIGLIHHNVNIVSVCAPAAPLAIFFFAVQTIYATFFYYRYRKVYDLFHNLCIIASYLLHNFIVHFCRIDIYSFH